PDVAPYLLYALGAPLMPALVPLNPASVHGGTPSTGTVILNGAAPTGGITVSLSSTSSAATVPTSVNVAAGAASASFTVTTTAVGQSTTSDITATYNGRHATATL